MLNERRECRALNVDVNVTEEKNRENEKTLNSITEQRKQVKKIHLNLI